MSEAAIWGAPTSLEFHGTEMSVTEQAKMVQMIASDHGGTHFAEVPVEKVHIGDIIAVKGQITASRASACAQSSSERQIAIGKQTTKSKAEVGPQK